MHKIRFLLLLLLLSTIYQPVFSQTKIPSKKEIIELSNEATRLMNSGKFEQSLIKSRAALQYAIAIKDDNTIATCYNTIAANFEELSEFDKAFFYYKKGLIYSDKANND